MMIPLQSSLCRDRVPAGRRALSRLLPLALAFGAVSAVHAQDLQDDVSQTASVEAQSEVLIVIPAHDMPEMIGDEVAVFPETLDDSKHVEVRRALLDDELNSGVLERRRLTAEERSALRLELLRAVRIAYPDDSQDSLR